MICFVSQRIKNASCKNKGFELQKFLIEEKSCRGRIRTYTRQLAKTQRLGGQPRSAEREFGRLYV